MTQDRWYGGPVPAGTRTDRLRLVPLTEAHTLVDLEAVLASADELRRWSDSEWPEPGFDAAANTTDLRRHREEHEQGVAFTYSVQTPDGNRVLGCIYVNPLDRALTTRGVAAHHVSAPPVAGGAAVVRGWIRADEPTALLDHLVDSSVGWLAGPSWHFPEVWWQAPTQLPAQLAACDRARLVRRIDVPGIGTGWQLRAPSLG